MGLVSPAMSVCRSHDGVKGEDSNAFVWERKTS